MNFSRREFLESAALGGLAVNTLMGAEIDKKTGMPTRILGRTGARVSSLAFGCGSRFLSGYKSEEEATACLNKVIDLGITYLDTAYGYGNGESETKVGHVMKTRRKEVWLATKIPDRTYDAAMKRVEESLKRLQSNPDLIHMHALMTAEELKTAESDNGVIKALYKLRDQKVCRAIGVTCHGNPALLKQALEHNDFDCTQMALNAAKVGNVFGKATEGYSGTFEQLALPVALGKKMGVTAMKIFAQERLNGKAPVEKLISYSMSLPVAATVIGMPQISHLEENVRIAKAFKPLSREEMDRLNKEMLPVKASIDEFMMHHFDC
jgi:aryl-alcohol dehydrogenase-like predicted oxidoreductase